MLLPLTCLSFGLPVSAVCMSVSQTSMDDSGHKGNTGQLLNSRVLGVLSVIALAMTQVSVCQSQSKLSQNSQFNLVLLLETNVLGVINEIASKQHKC